MLDKFFAQTFLTLKHFYNIEYLSCFSLINGINKIHKIIFVCEHPSYFGKIAFLLPKSVTIFVAMPGNIILSVIGQFARVVLWGISV